MATETRETRETSIIDQLFLELSQFTNARTRDEIKFDKLIYAVMKKYPGESRFETALRYIREAENTVWKAQIEKEAAPED